MITDDKSFGRMLRSLDVSRLVPWVLADSRDDFFRDPILYKDLEQTELATKAIQKHDVLHFERSRKLSFEVPKSEFLTRTGLALELPPKVLLQNLFLHLHPLLEPLLGDCVYGYRPTSQDLETKDPFSNNLSGRSWVDFTNEHRRNLIDHNAWGVETDLANFFEHIRVDKLHGTLALLLQGGAEADRGRDALVWLEALLHWIARDRLGIMQNNNVSSFICSTMLTEFDRLMSRHTDIAYQRYIDDIRLVAPTRGRAIAVLNDMQSRLRERGFFLNPKKTSVYGPGSSEWLATVHPGIEPLLGEIDIALELAIEPTIRHLAEKATRELRELVDKADFPSARPLAAKLVDLAAFPDVGQVASSTIQEASILGLTHDPSRADQWSRVLSHFLDDGVRDACVEFLQDESRNQHPWVNMHVLVSLARHEEMQPQDVDLLRRLARDDSQSLLVRSWATIALARFCDKVDTLHAAEQLTDSSDHESVRRCAIIAAQECHRTAKEALWNRACDGRGSLRLLCESLANSKPLYDRFARRERAFGVTDEAAIEGRWGIGIVGGERVEFTQRNAKRSVYEELEIAETLA